MSRRSRSRTEVGYDAPGQRGWRSKIRRPRRGASVLPLSDNQVAVSVRIEGRLLDRSCLQEHVVEAGLNRSFVERARHDQAHQDGLGTFAADRTCFQREPFAALGVQWLWRRKAGGVATRARVVVEKLNIDTSLRGLARVDEGVGINRYQAFAV